MWRPGWRIRRWMKDPSAAPYDALAAAHECVLVEGVGGWEVPIGPGRNFSDVAADFKLPVLLVIGNKLGAINHALLTLNAVKARGLECLGIVFNNVKDEWVRPA